MSATAQPYFIENTKDLSNIKRAVITIAGARRKYVSPLSSFPNLLAIIKRILTRP
jgi:hypothetical protein